MNYRCALAVLVSLALMFPFATVMAGFFDPARDWRTLEGENFRVHFHGDMEPLARRTLAISERVHAEVTARMDWMPAGKTEVVLVDSEDQPQGFASPIPFNMMGIYITPPEPGGFVAADSVDQWLELLITHEYTHVVHGDKVAGVPRLLRRVFGRHIFTLPYAFQPLWLIEGLATHAETDDAHRIGRGQGAQADMIMRTEVATGIRPLAQVNAPNASWPTGSVPYYYGVAFHRFLAEQHGEAAINRMVDTQAGRLLPFRLPHDIDALWSEFMTWLARTHEPQLAAIRAAGVRDGVAVSDGGAVRRGEGGVLQVTADGAVYFIENRGNHAPRLVRTGQDGSLTRMTRVHPGARFSVHPTAGVMIAQPEQCGEYRMHFDLYILEHGASAPRRLTRCSRYRDVAWHPDGDRLVALRWEKGRSSLHLVDAEGAELSVLATSGDDALMAHPAWSPDGRRLTIVRTQRGAGANLHELDVASGTWRQLTHDVNFPIRPSYTRDGSGILFSSDHGGVIDVRRLTLVDGTVETLTRVETGAFDPVDGPHGVHFLMYGRLGHDIRRLPHDAATHELPAADALPAPQVGVVEHPGSVRRYNPLQTARPTAWVPYIRLDTDITDLGVTLFGTDALGKHDWSATPIFDAQRNRMIGGVSYEYADRLLIELGRQNLSRGYGVAQADSSEVVLRLPRTTVLHSWEFMVGAADERERDIHLRDGASGRDPTRDSVAGAALVFDSAQAFRLSPSRQEGRQVRLVFEQGLGGADFTGSVAAVDWREYVHLGAGRVLGLRYARGHAEATARPFALGGNLPEATYGTFSNRGGIFGKRRYGLRGYNENPALVGTRMHVAAVEYRFPIMLVERSRYPIGLQRISGAAFIEAGDAAFPEESLGLNPAFGVELHLDVPIGYRFGPARMRIGAAHGTDTESGGTSRIYFGVSSAF